MRIFLISDTHFFHDSMKRYENRPDQFNSIIIENWNKMVDKRDLVIHLGDVIFGYKKEKTLPPILKTLNGKKILTLGNHDLKPWDWYMRMGFHFVTDYFVYEQYAFSHAPLTPLPHQAKRNHEKQVVLNYHGHFHKSFHRVGKDGDVDFNDDFYDYKYFNEHRENYHLIQIEDSLSPILLNDLLK